MLIAPARSGEVFVLSATIAALLVQVGVAISGGATVRGVVRDDATGRAIAGTRVEVADATLATRSDTDGAYVLTGVLSGSHRVRFVAPSYDTLVVDVTLLADAPLRLDVALTRAAETLAAVRVIARPRRATDTTQVRVGVGGWHLSRADLTATPASDTPDMFQLLATAPQAQVRVESQAAVNVRGGSSDQNLFLLDGAPVYSPLHGSQTMSAFSPDIVDELVLHGGAPSARYGGRLSSVIDVRTTPAIPTAVSSRGALGGSAVQSALALPLVAGRAGLTVAARHSFEGLLHGGSAEVSLPGTWSDAYAKLGLRMGSADVAVSSLFADNGLGFPSSVTSDGGGVVSPGPRHNQFEWATATQAISARQTLGDRASVEAHAWRTRFDALANWDRRGGSVALGSTLRNSGGSGSLTVRHDVGEITAGFEAQRMTTAYDVTPTPSVDSAASAPPHAFRLASDPLDASAFIDSRWRAGRAWTIDAGLRTTAASGVRPRLEPRLTFTFQPTRRTTLSAGYARMHQFPQSLRNEESVLGAILAPDFLVGAGAAGVPVARSDEFVASASGTFDEHTRLDLDWYTRALHGLVLVAPVTGEPFATSAFATGSGHAWGGSASLTRRLERFSMQGFWSLGEVTRRTGAASYRPAFAPGQALALAAAYRVGSHTRLRTSIWASSGRTTTPLGDDIGWDTRDALSGARELSGTPARTAGPLGSSPLPDYVRIDVGVRHVAPLGRSGGSLTGFVDVNNVFAHENVAGYVSPVGTAVRRPLGMLPSSLLVGMEWRY